jgi:tRNA threonylcarbamoyl adenosine modification protein (Sua5/YciO/YrdC/YwlC family)
MIIEINPINPQKRLINQIAQSLKNGAIIAYPTDTFYGIGCDIMNKNAIEKIYQLKRQKKSKPFSFICSDISNISKYMNISNFAFNILKRHLPGPYTFILEGSRIVPKIMLTKRRAAGVRVPLNNICIDLVKALGNPILSTTATRSEDCPLKDAFEIQSHFQNNINIIINGGKVPQAPSTVVSLLNDYVEILRQGLGEIY